MAEGRTRRRRRGWAVPVTVTAVISGVLTSGAMVWRASEAAFSGSTANPANSWTAGSGAMTDDDGGNSPITGTAMFTGGYVKPGSTNSHCIKVTYTGNIASGDVKIYSAADTGTTLGGYITMTVELGTVASTAT